MRAHTLAEAMVMGEGVERAFLCPDHPDTRPSASLNIIKGVWYCYTCGSHGGAEEHVEANLDALQKYLWTHTHIPDVYPESWLNLYDSGDPHDYWLSRFSEQAARAFRLGHDPEHDAVTFPLRDSGQRVLGVVQRKLGDHDGPKYKYPFGIDVSNYLFNFTPDQRSVVVLTEGATDAIALWEAGVDAFAIYGSRMSKRQVSLINKVDPEIILCAFDMDEAGANAYGHVHEMNPDRVVGRVRWDYDLGKDMAMLGVEDRAKYVRVTLDMVEKRRLGLQSCASSSHQHLGNSESKPSETSSRPGKLLIRPSRPKSKQRLILRAS